MICTVDNEQFLVITAQPAVRRLTEMSYIIIAAVALMRVSMAAALIAIPPQPQIPMIPMRSGSTFSCTERKSTAAQKSSVLMSGDARIAYLHAALL